MTAPVRRLFPSPALSLTVALAWLLLVGSLATAHMLFALVLAWLLPHAAQRLRHSQAGLRRPAVIVRLSLIVLWDIVLSNIEVARRILGSESAIRPDYIWIPLDIENPYGIAALAGIITMTPGTLSADLSPDNRHLLVHCFHLDDGPAQIDQIKQRYERPLREIFS